MNTRIDMTFMTRPLSSRNIPRLFAAGFAAAVLAAVMGERPAVAAQYDWDNGSFNSLWSNPKNWLPANEPGSGDYVTFSSLISGAQTINLDFWTEIQAIQHSSSATANYTVQAPTGAAGNLTLDGSASFASENRYLTQECANHGLIFQNGPGALTLSLNTGTADTSFFTTDPKVGVTINCVLAEATPGSGFIKDGPGVLILGAANTYTGNTRINKGTLNLTDALALQTSTLDMSNSATDTGTLSFGTLTAATVGGLTGSRNLSLTNNSAAAVALSVGNNNTDTTYSGALGGSGSLTKIGTGMLTLSGANTFAGGATVQTGTLQFGAANALAASAVTLTGDATLDANSQSPVLSALIGVGSVINNSGTLSVTGNLTTASSHTTYSCFWGTINSGGLVKNGTHAMALRGANTFDGATTVTAGTLSVGSAPDRLPVGTSLSVASGANFQLDANNQTVASLSGAGRVNLGGGMLTVNPPSGVSTFSGVIQNSQLPGSSTALGNGLRGYYYTNIDFTGLYAVRDDSMVNIPNMNATSLPAGMYPKTNQISVRWLGQILTTAAGTYTFTTTCDDGSRLWVNGTMVVSNWVEQGATAISGTIDLEASTRYDLLLEYYNNGGPGSALLSWTPPDDSSTVIPAANLFLPGPGTLVKSGSGLQQLTAASAYTGGTIVSGGTLEATTGGALGSGNVTVNDGATLKLDSNTVINSAADLVVSGSAFFANLSYSGTDTIHALSLDGGVTHLASGTYGSSSSTAANKYPVFAGSGILNVTAGASANSLTLSVGSDLSIYGSPVTFRAAISGSAGTPTGMVTFYDGASPIGTVALTSGIASLAVSNLWVISSPHSITAVYSGNTTYAPSTSPPLSHTTTVASAFPSVTVSNKVYDQTTSALIAALSFSGVLPSDANYVHLAGGTATATFATKTAGLNKTVNITGLGPISGSLAGNYVLGSTTATTTATISNALVTVTGITANNKTYDNTTPATIVTGSAALGVGVINGDTVTLITTGATGAFADANAGTGKVVTVSGLTLGGADGANYSVTPPTTTATINKANSLVFALTASPLTSTAPAGTPVTFTASVRSSPTGLPTPTSNVVFAAEGVAFTTNALASGVATSTATSSLTAGLHTILATYAGDNNYLTSTKSILYTVLAASTATPAKITRILYGNPLTISGTGPVSHPFALVSSTNVAKAMNLWTPEQTNSANTGSFSFSVTPGTSKAKFFRVITQ
jgi:autotransporter-associated beta strand protein